MISVFPFLRGLPTSPKIFIFNFLLVADRRDLWPVTCGEFVDL
jgi:hypothetical protein